ncbi:site-specific integrase [Wenzhouxiangella sediminis]|uniref:Site-specific integrase n=1 Tax=Wenzhouxiangella sediminis TaxID=1792836 RepID=A0A3E1KB36_9GAMM|nr:site-specific integrase [Wenzhouxiangella sediminis]
MRKLARYLGATDWHQINWAGLGYAGVNALLARLAADAPSAAGFNAARAALRGVFHQAFLLGQVGHETLLRVQSIKGERISRDKESSGRYLSAGELEVLFANCDDETRRGSRDAAVIAILAFTGLRRAEAAALELRDVQLGEDVVVRWGKGRKARRVPLIAPTTQRIQSWLLARGTEPGALFIRRVSWKDRVLDPGLSDQAIYDIVRNRSGAFKCSPHDLRRTFVSNLLAASQDLSAARRLAGHSSTDTTAIYDRRAEIADQQAMEKLNAEMIRE